jgi:hypothetical protein
MKDAPAPPRPDRLIRPTPKGRITLVEARPAAKPPAKGGRKTAAPG